MDKPAEFSVARAQAIDFLNRGVTATCGQEGIAPDKAMGYQLIGSAVMLDPTLAQGWYVMANANGDLGLRSASVANYRRALQLPKGTELGDLTDDTRANLLCNLGHTLFHLGKHTEAMENIKASLATDGKKSLAWVTKSMIHSVRGQDEDAIKSAERGFSIDPTNPTVETALAFALLHAKQYEKGLRHFEARFPYKLKQFLNYPYPKWQGEEGAELFLVSDQGIGDSIDFLRFVPLAQQRCKKIYLGAQPELMRLLQSMFGQYENIHLMALPQPFPPATHWAALMSLPTALGLSDEEIATTPMPEFETLHPAPEWKTLNAKMHIGVAWSGAKLNEVDQWRSVPIEQFLDLCRVPNVQFYSLQVGDRAQELHGAGAATLFRDISPYVRDVMDTLSIMNHMDMVICVDTGLGHMAGIMNKPTWIPVSFNGCCWRFSRHGEKSLWYDQHRLYRQGEDCNWQPVFDRMVADLDALVNG